MDRSIKLWVLLLCFLLWALFTVAFGWAVWLQLTGNRTIGVFGKAAASIASFPTTALEVLRELNNLATGEYKDEQIRIEREPGEDYSDYQPVPAPSALAVPGLLVKTGPDRPQAGWRLVLGAFDINGTVENAALLLNPELAIERIWLVDEVAIGDREPRPKYRKFIHGVEILRDGSLIVAYDGGISLQKFDACGARLWSVAGDFHHAVTLDEQERSVWTFLDDRTVAQVDIGNGQLLRQFNMDEIIAKNPAIDILELRREHDGGLGGNARNTAGSWLADPFHLNDVDPLPSRVAARFPKFRAGDLLLSSRNLNLLFVVDPESLEVKWWRIGSTQRQHDPDWLPNGQIMVLNNRMSRDYSEVIAVDPETHKTSVLLDGRSNNFYTRIRGKEQQLNDGTLVVTSSQQGRAFEIGPQGRTMLELANTKPGSSSVNYVISELRWLPPDFFGKEIRKCQ